ncbi:hypothetical protein TNCV_2410591 [Trichonephila clavipes]|nr:hypothetical protein TNCV_2410591 [Trichonephila clavipes]
MRAHTPDPRCKPSRETGANPSTKSSQKRDPSRYNEYQSSQFLESNEKADELAPIITALIDTNAVASRKLINNNFKYSIPDLNRSCTMASIITRLRTKHVKGIKISTDG